MSAFRSLPVEPPEAHRDALLCAVSLLSAKQHSLTLPIDEMLYDVNAFKDQWHLAKDPKSPFVLSVRSPSSRSL